MLSRLVNVFLSDISICNHNSLRGLKKKNENTTFKMQQTENDKPRKSKGCPILRQIYVWYPTNLCMVFYCINIVQKYKNKERSKTMRNLTKPCINLSEYWTSMEKVGSPRLPF